MKLLHSLALLGLATTVVDANYLRSYRLVCIKNNNNRNNNSNNGSSYRRRTVSSRRIDRIVRRGGGRIGADVPGKEGYVFSRTCEVVKDRRMSNAASAGSNNNNSNNNSIKIKNSRVEDNSNNINCSTCPNGYFDGCNNCVCSSTGTAGCTRRVCGPGDTGKPTCNTNRGDDGDDNDSPPRNNYGNNSNNEEEKVNCDTCPSGYYDGCNQCSCTPNGNALCTLRFCAPGDKGEPKCNASDGDGNQPNTKDEINCDTCPSGYYDGCNNCSCSSNGLAACTLRFCAPGDRGEPKCNANDSDGNQSSIKAEINCDTCPSGYFDGCNECTCSSDGSAGCTRRFCAPGDRSEPKCNANDGGGDDSPRNNDEEVNCDTCPSGYFDGCNDCTCNSDGSAGCTRRFCAPGDSSEPKCNANDGGGNQPNNKDEINCDTCPSGYYDGCNQCSCGSNGFAACTLRFCPPEDIGKAECNSPSDEDDNSPSEKGATDEVNCNTCPYGYFDGCNKCTCGSDGFAGCTRRFCAPGDRSEPKCIDGGGDDSPSNNDEEVNCDTCPSGYYDGCNNCSCTSNGLALCTQRFCAPRDTGEAKCNVGDDGDDSPEEVNCDTCRSGYYDGCNQCSCTPNGNALCTLRFCAPGDKGEPKCNANNDGGNQPNNKDEINCETCPSGYYDGCNNCSCSSNGLAACTLRFCAPGDKGEPNCNADDRGNQSNYNDNEINCDTCPSGYYDGCNQCSCSSDGLAACTYRLCAPEDTGKAKCNASDGEDSLANGVTEDYDSLRDEEEVNCNTCSSGYFDGCNNCVCSSTGEAGCTRRVCRLGEKGKPKCNDDTRSVSKPSPSCESCPNGLFDGCNNCKCNSDGKIAGCTRRLCSVNEAPRCL